MASRAVLSPSRLLATVLLTLSVAGAALAAPPLAAPTPSPALAAWMGAPLDGYARTARATFARLVRPRSLVSDLLVDTAADDASDANSPTDCSDGVSDGDCSLREAIEVANANPGPDTIGFDIPGGGVATIQPTSALPTLSDAGITIDGYTQPGASPNTLAVGTDAVLQVEIDGQSAGAGVDGLTLAGSDQEIRGLVINRFTRYGVSVFSSGAIIAGNYVGLNATGTADLGNGSVGIFILNAPGARIGTDGDGTADEAERNVVSGNVAGGIQVTGSTATGAVVAGNHVGTNAAGDADLGNGNVGVYISDAPNARIGTDGDGAADEAERNVISGNDADGIHVTGSAATGVVVAGNHVGTNAAAGADLGNGGVGVYIFDAPNARIGTDGDGTADEAERNVVSGNDADGIHVTGSTATGAVVAGNHVGTNAAGDADLGNGWRGIVIVNAPGARVGTDGDGTADEAERNVVSGNDADGIHVTGSAATGVVVAGNHVGTDAAGTTALGNGSHGVVIINAPGARVGTDGDGTADEAERNVVSGNVAGGIQVTGSTATGAVVAGNHVGTNAAGDADLGNGIVGVFISDAPDARIGTDGDGAADEAERNVISGNDFYGVLVTGSSATGAVIAGNHVGTNAAGDADLGNMDSGIYIDSAPDARIGTDGDGTADEAEGNLIRANGADGVYVTSAGSASILGNAIDGNAGLGIDLAGGTEDADGVTANDPDDPDTGASGLQNVPIVTAATSSFGVEFTLDSAPSTGFRVELFASDAADPSGYGEGARFLGAVTVTTDASGDAGGSLPASLVAEGDVVSLTATPITGPTTYGGTSEFSAVGTVTSGLAASASIDGAEGWRMLASPEATTVDGFLGALWTQGFSGSDSPAGECTVYVFDETGASFAEGWTCATDATDALTPGQGVMVYVYADDDPRPQAPGIQGGFPKTLTSSSAVTPPASFAFSVIFTDDGRTFGQKGWNLLGTPHGASLDWAAMDRTAVNNTAYVYDPAHNGGDYRTVTSESGVVYGDLTEGRIPPFQGFFVRALGAAPSLVATDAAAEPAEETYGRTAAPTVVRLALSDASGERSAAWVSLSDGAALGTDAMDAPRLQPTAWPRAVLFTTALGDGAPLVANVLPTDLGGATSADVPLDVTLGGYAGEVALSLTATAEALPDGWTLTLVDRQTGAETPLTDGVPAAFTVPGDASGLAPPAALTLPAALASPTALARLGNQARFVLRIATDAFVTALPGDDVLTTGLGLVAPNPTSGAATLLWSLAEAGAARVSVVDLLGREVAVLADGSFTAGVHRAAVPAETLAPGVYVVRLIAGDVGEAARFTVVR